MIPIPAVLRRQSTQICSALLAYLLIGQLLGALARAMLSAGSSDTKTALVSLFVRLLSIALPILALIFLEPPNIVCWFSPAKGDILFRGVISFFGCSFAAMLLNYILAQLPQLLGFAPFSNPSSPLPDGTSGVLLTYLGLAVIPALLEEFLFRGLILRRLLPFGTRFAVLTSALLFALLHRDLIRLPGIFLLGALFGRLAADSGSLLPGMLLHLLNNTLSLTLGYLGQTSPESSRTLQILFLAICAVSAVVVFVRFLLQKPARKAPISMQTRGIGTIPRFFSGLPAVAFLLVWLFTVISFGGLFGL